MEPGGFAPLGLLLAAAMSVTNVMTDVWRKRALDQRDLFPATFWIRVAVAVVFAVVLLVQMLRGVPVVIRDGGLLFGLFQLAPVPTFFIYLVLDVGLITIVMWLYFRALQISPLSMCIPFLAFTPVFLIPSTYIILGQKPEPIKLLGVALIVVGLAGDAPATVRGGLAGSRQSGAGIQGQPLHADCGVDLLADQPAGREAGEDERRLHRELRLRSRALHFVLPAFQNAEGRVSPPPRKAT